MIEIDKIKMYQLGQDELEDRQMRMLIGGGSCSCECSGGYLNWDGYNYTMLQSGGGTYDDLCACSCSGSSSTSSNDAGNIAYGYGSSGDHNGNCVCACGGNNPADSVGSLQK